MADSLPSFDTLASRLTPLGALGSPAELHGMLCGRLCGGGRYSDREWLDAARECLGLVGSADAETEGHLAQLYQVTLEQFRDNTLGLDLLLPDDDTAMDQRLLALSHWCSGFLAGFGGAGISGETHLSADTADALRDFAAFVQINPDEEGGEDAETDFTEIVEYIRVASLTM